MDSPSRRPHSPGRAVLNQRRSGRRASKFTNSAGSLPGACQRGAVFDLGNNRGMRVGVADHLGWAVVVTTSAEHHVYAIKAGFGVRGARVAGSPEFAPLFIEDTA